VLSGNSPASHLRGPDRTLVDTSVSTATWRIVLLASLGGTLEFYDFVIFGVFAKDIADAIFPNPTPLISLMVSFAAFAAGYLARPLGGIVLSHFGDRYGRRRVFLAFTLEGAGKGAVGAQHAG
jgi:MFS transporter, MHS family, proline/betaine transporter